MKKIVFLNILILISIFMYGCYSNDPSKLLIGKWTCDTDKYTTFHFIFNENGELNVTGFINNKKFASEDAYYVVASQSENDVVVNTFARDKKTLIDKLIISFKNKHLFDIKGIMNDEGILCRRIK